MIHILFVLLALTGTVAFEMQQLPAKDPVYTFGKEIFEWIRQDNTDMILSKLDPALDDARKETVAMSLMRTVDQFKEKGAADAELLNVLSENYEGNLKAVYLPYLRGKDITTIKIDTVTTVNDTVFIRGNFRHGIPAADEKLSLGYRLYLAKCYACHGKYGQGTIGPNLTDVYWKFVKSEQDIFDVIKNGKEGTMMIPYKDYLSDEEIDAIVKYLGVLSGQRMVEGKGPEGEPIEIVWNIYP